MALVGTLLFCRACGNLLEREPPDTKMLRCGVCLKENKNDWPTTITTMSKPTAFPSALRQKRSVGNRSAARARTRATSEGGKHRGDDVDMDVDDDDADDADGDGDGDEDEDLAAEAWPSTREACPACDNPELLFKAVQLRSADEGTTIFYRCGRCGHRFKADN